MQHSDENYDLSQTDLIPKAGSTTYQLCDIQQVIQSLYASFSSSVTESDDTDLTVLVYGPNCIMYEKHQHRVWHKVESQNIETEIILFTSFPQYLI